MQIFAFFIFAVLSLVQIIQITAINFKIVNLINCPGKTDQTISLSDDFNVFYHNGTFIIQGHVKFAEKIQDSWNVMSIL